MKEIMRNKLGVNRRGSANNDLLQFFIGFIMFAAGVFWLLNIVEVHTSFGMGYHLGSMRINTGVILIPLLVGIGMMFFLEGKKTFIGVLVAAAGLLLILVALISSVSIHIRHTNGFAFILMFGMIAAGAGLVLKTAFKK